MTIHLPKPNFLASLSLSIFILCAFAPCVALAKSAETTKGATQLAHPTSKAHSNKRATAKKPNTHARHTAPHQASHQAKK
jgi:hypothetical protein